MIEICRSVRESRCQVCKQLIPVGDLKIRFMVANHSESLCLSCCPHGVIEHADDCDPIKVEEMVGKAEYVISPEFRNGGRRRKD